MHQVDPQTFYQKFLQHLSSDSKAYQVWNSPPPWNDKAWTSAMTTVLARTTRDLVDKSVQISAKGTPDKYGRKEYFTLDVCAYDDVNWCPPLVIIEHENSCEKWKVQYCAWKLLCVEAQLRVLVAYADPKKLSPSCVSSRDGIRAAVEEVRNHYQQKSILLVAGEWRVQELQNVFELYPLGFGINHSLRTDLPTRSEMPSLP